MKKLIIFIFCVVGIFPWIARAEEASLTEEYLKGVYFILTPKTGDPQMHQQAIFRLNGKIAYCLEPGVGAKAGNYKVTEGLSGSYLSKENRKKVEEFGYYGYEYPGHQENRFYLAAQELIWELVSDYEVTWVTTFNLHGQEINIEKEKQEILDLISESKRKPSFDSKQIHLYESEILELSDDNQVLDTFQINSDLFSIKENRLISDSISKNMKVKGTLKPYDSEITLLYRQDNSQKMATLRLSEPTTFEIDVVMEGKSIKIHKIGEVWNGIWNSGEWKNQSGVEFEIYANEDIKGHFGNILYMKGEYIETIVTKNGYAETRKLPNGKYRFVETKGKDGYSIIGPLEIEINNSVEKELEVELKNYLSTGKVEIVKKDINGNLLAGVIFGLYSKSGRKLDEQTTDENGKIVWERLPIGEYQIRELETKMGLILDTRKEKIIVTEKEPLIIEKVNVPLLPNTSGSYEKDWSLVIGFIGLYLSKKLLK